MNDYNKLKDVLEMAELLDDLTDTTLECKTVSVSDDKTVTVVFVFNEFKELIKIYTEE